MKNIIILIFTISVVFLSCKSNQSQKNLLNKQTLEYLSDYDEFIDTLTKTHPALYEFTSKDKFEKKISQLRNEINNNTTKRGFIWKLSEMIAYTGCGHSSLGFFNQQRDLLEPNEYFPLQVRWINNKLYISDTFINGQLVKKGEEILSINNTLVSEIINNIYKHINSQAKILSAKNRMFNGYATSYIPYALNFPKYYTIKTENSRNSIKLKSLDKLPSYPSLFNPNSVCQEQLCLNELDAQTALLTLRTFAYYGDKTSVFIAFLNNSFKEIKDKGYKNLIIDVRGNLGGTNHVTRHLLRQTLQNPFQFYADKGSDLHSKEIEMPFKNNFNGKIVFLMNGEGYSSVGHLASIYKDRNRVTFIGENLGSNQFSTANQKQFELTNTTINYTVARNIFFTKVKEQDRSIIIKPDYEVIQSIDDYIKNKDTALDYALKMLKKEE